MKIYYTKDNLTPDIDVSLKPPVVLRDTGEDNRDYSRHYRRWQSAPCLVRTPKGRLLCTFSGDNSTEAWECPNNYNQISYSDNGRDWHQEAFVIDHPDSVRMHEPILWLDPQGRLWHFPSGVLRYAAGGNHVQESGVRGNAGLYHRKLFH